MARINLQMLGKLEVSSEAGVWEGPEIGKVRELFCFLLIHPRATRPREEVAEALWGNLDSYHSKKNLRQALWKLQSECDARMNLQGARLVLACSDRLSINPAIDLWVDAAAVDEIYTSLPSNNQSDFGEIETIKEVVNHYRGEFLPGCCQDWCIYERERLQNMYLSMLDRLIIYCLSRKEYKEGIRYGHRVLAHDPASERAHRQIIKLHYCAGDRTAAIRQYERCVSVLKKELGVLPDSRTTQLYEQIKSGLTVGRSKSASGGDSTPRAELAGNYSLHDIISHLRQLQRQLTEIQQQINQDIQLVEALAPKRDENA